MLGVRGNLRPAHKWSQGTLLVLSRPQQPWPGFLHLLRERTVTLAKFVDGAGSIQNAKEPFAKDSSNSWPLLTSAHAAMGKDGGGVRSRIIT